MPTPLTDAIQALTRYANETTGASDTTLSDAVATLVEGYGQGGGNFESGKIIGDGERTSSATRIYTSKKNIVLYSTDSTGHAKYDIAMIYAKENFYLSAMFNGTSVGSYIYESTAGTYCKFYDTYIDLYFACNGLWCALQNGTTYEWVAWDDNSSTANLLLNGLVGGDIYYDGTLLPKSVSFVGQSFTNVSLPNVTNLRNGTLKNASETLSGKLFGECSEMVSFYAPKATRVSDGILTNNVKLESVNLRSLVDTGSSLCENCQSLKGIVLPSVNVIYSSAFNSCYNLEYADFLGGNYVGNYSFFKCYKLTKLIIRKTGGVCSMNLSNAFNNTPLTGYNGLTADLYVPSALISSYQSANNWSTILSNGYTTIHAIEGSIYETQYADGTPIE